MEKLLSLYRSKLMSHGRRKRRKATREEERDAVKKERTENRGCVLQDNNRDNSVNRETWASFDSFELLKWLNLSFRVAGPRVVDASSILSPTISMLCFRELMFTLVRTETFLTRDRRARVTLLLRSPPPRPLSLVWFRTFRNSRSSFFPSLSVPCYNNNNIRKTKTNRALRTTIL